MNYKIVFLIAVMLSTASTSPLCACGRVYTPLCALIQNEKRTFSNFCEYKCVHDYVIERGGAASILINGVPC
ncbi:unnamed protein product [Arctia plantaginis]|nr:unnamed protein product [Arctia plantaginis]